MTHFFDLPKHLREVIYRKAHFLEMRLRLSEHLVRRAPVREYKSVSSQTGLSVQWTVSLKVSDTKRIFIEVHAFDWSTELTIVDACDYTGLRLFWFPDWQHDGTMKVFLATEHSVRSSFIRPWQEGIAPTNPRTREEWFGDRRNIHTHFQDTT